MKRRILTVFIAFCLMLTAMVCLASCRDLTLPPDNAGEGDSTTLPDTTTAPVCVESKPDFNGYERPVVPMQFGCDHEYDMFKMYPVSISDEMLAAAVNGDNIKNQENGLAQTPIFVIDSYDELAACDALFKIDYLDYSPAMLQTRYADHDFDNNSLVIAYFFASSGSNKYAMSSVDISDGRLVINFLQVLNGKTDDAASWITAISVPREELADVTDYRLDIQYGEIFAEDSSDGSEQAYLMMLDKGRYMLDFGTADNKRSFGIYEFERGNVNRLTLTDDESKGSYVFDISDYNTFRYVANESTAENFGIGDAFSQILKTPDRVTQYKQLKGADISVTDVADSGSAGEICDRLEALLQNAFPSTKKFAAVTVTSADGADRLKERYGYDMTAYDDSFFEKNYVLIAFFLHPTDDGVELRLLGYDNYAPRVGVRVTGSDSEMFSPEYDMSVGMFEVPTEFMTGRVVFAVS